jgi:hypothetical protein
MQRAGLDTGLCSRAGLSTRAVSGNELSAVPLGIAFGRGQRAMAFQHCTSFRAAAAMVILT